MIILRNIIIMLLETLYYTIYLSYSRGSKQIGKYYISLLLSSFLVLIFGNNLISYLIFIISIIFSIKKIIKEKASLYDVFNIIIMLAVKLITESISVLIFYNIFKSYVLSVIGIISFKLILVFLIKKKLHLIYLKIKKLWDNNNFYIRYAFVIFTYLYVIVSVLFLIYR